MGTREGRVKGLELCHRSWVVWGAWSRHPRAEGAFLKALLAQVMVQAGGAKFL